MSRKGIPCSEETKLKLSSSAKKRYEEKPEYKKMVGDTHRGMHHSDETRIQMSIAHKKRYEEHPEERAAAVKHLIGIPRSEETKKKISAAHIGMQLPKEIVEIIRQKNIGRKASDETKIKMSLVRKGLPKSQDHRDKIGNGNRGKYVSPEVCQKISISKIEKQLSGEKCHLWKGGISFEPYCQKFNNEFKNRVRNFFGNACVECGSPQIKEKLNVHHVNFDKQTCCNEGLPLFVPLCRSCHTKTNTNRKYWETHFTEMINNYYGGKCYFTIEEMTALNSKCDLPIAGVPA